MRHHDLALTFQALVIFTLIHAKLYLKSGPRECIILEKRLTYSSSIKSRPYLYIETKKLADLVLRGFNELQLKEQVIDDNLFQVKTESRKREIASTILNRLKGLDDYLIRQITIGDVQTSKIVVLYAIVKTDRLFYEFMREVFSEKITYQDFSLSDRDFHAFFEGKRQQSDTVASWKDYTLYKLRQVYIRILCEAGLLNKQKRGWHITIPIIDPEVYDHVQKTDGPRFIRVMTGDTAS